VDVASGAVCAGSNPAGGTSPELRKQASYRPDEAKWPISPLPSDVGRRHHAGDPHVLESRHAPSVDAHLHLDTVPGPRGDLGGRVTRMQAAGDTGVP
jgi:hypothetical protein